MYNTQTMYNNNQSTANQNVNIAGVNKYATRDCGAAFANTANVTADLNMLFPQPVNGDAAVLWNTNGATGRHYVYANNLWKFMALT